MGLPGWMKWSFTPEDWLHKNIALLVISGPLFKTIVRGKPRFVPKRVRSLALRSPEMDKSINLPTQTRK